MFFISLKQASAILALLTTPIYGHMILGQPVPFAFADSATQQSPLDPDGSNYPCKFPPGFQPEQHTQNAPMAPGSSNPLSFIGGATHGGGSCQVSLTTDTVPTKDSKWEVILSIEGGCPSDAEGNLSNDALDTGSSQFSYTIPSDMAAGKYTLAWTWFNKIGNREMYMNCAPIEVGAGSAKRQITKVNKKRQNSRPDIMLANIGNGCATSEGASVKFPIPGDSLEMGDGATLAPPTGECGSAAPASDSTSTTPTTGGSSGDSGSAGSASSVPEPQASTAAPAAPEAPEAPEASATPATPATPAVADSPPQAVVPVSSSAPSSSASAAAVGAPCSEEGLWVCAPDGSSYTRCASGIMTAPLTMPTGLKCAPGPTMNFEMIPEKRSIRFGPRHISRASLLST